MPDTALARAVATYVAAWNCPDEPARRTLLQTAFAADGDYVDPAVRLHGREALVTHSRRFADRWPGARVAVTSAVDEHAGGACFTWAVLGADGTTLREGLDVVEADDTGRLRRVTGFFGGYRSPRRQGARSGMHDNERVLRAALDAIGSGDALAYAEVAADDLVVHVPGRSRLSGELHGRGIFGVRVRELTGGTLTIDVHDVLASDEHAVGIYTMRVQCPGRSLEWRQVNVYHVRHGKIVEVWQNPVEQDAFDTFFS